MARKKRNWEDEEEEKDFGAPVNIAVFDSYIKPGFKFFSPKPVNDYCIRILPPAWKVPSRDHWGLYLYVHTGIGPDNSSYLCNRAFEKHCLDKWGMTLLEYMKLCELEIPENMECPIEEIRIELKRSGQTEDAKKLFYRTKFLVWLIDRDDEAAGPKLWAMPYTQMHLALEECCQSTRGRGVIRPDNVDTGRDVLFKCKKQGEYNNYIGVKLDEPSTLTDDDDLFNQWLDYIEANPLPNLLHFYDGNYIRKVATGETLSRKEDVKELEEINIASIVVGDVETMSRDGLEQVAKNLGFRAATVKTSTDDDLKSDILSELFGLSDDGEVKKEEEEPVEAREEGKDRAAMYRERFEQKKRGK